MSETGLTSEQARTRLEAEGPNALPESDRRSGLRIIGEVLREPMLVLLILSPFVGPLRYVVIVGFLAVLFGLWLLLVTMRKRRRAGKLQPPR